MALDKFIISGLLLGLFSLSFFMFTYFLINNNNDNNNQLLQDKSFNQTFYSINNSLNDIQTTSEEQYNSTSKEPINVGFGSLIYFSIRNAGNIFGGMVTSILNPIFNLVLGVLGVSPVVIAVFISIVLVTLIFLAWKMYRLGA